MTRAERGRRLGAAGAAAFALALALATPVAAQWRSEGRPGGRGGAYQDRGERRGEPRGEVRSGPRGGGGWGAVGGWSGGGERRAYGGRGDGGPAYPGGDFRAQGFGGYDGYRRAPAGGRPAGAARAWRRGETLPDGYRGATVPDPGRYHLRRPPNGYDWVGDNRNAYLMQRSTGMVLDSVPGAYEPPPPFRGRRR